MQSSVAACSPADLKQPIAFSNSRQPPAAGCRSQPMSNTPNVYAPAATSLKLVSVATVPRQASTQASMQAPLKENFLDQQILPIKVV